MQQSQQPVFGSNFGVQGGFAGFTGVAPPTKKAENAGEDADGDGDGEEEVCDHASRLSTALAVQGGISWPFRAWRHCVYLLGLHCIQTLTRWHEAIDIA